MAVSQTCEICESNFVSTHCDAMYCSVECRNKARYIKYPAKYRAKTLATYGLEEQDYLRMLDDQDCVCAICGKEESVINIKTGYPYPLCVDHDHITGEVRSLLCRHCNLVLGQVEKRPEIVAKCLDYLDAVKELKRVKGVA